MSHVLFEVRRVGRDPHTVVLNSDTGDADVIDVDGLTAITLPKWVIERGNGQEIVALVLYLLGLLERARFRGSEAGQAQLQRELCSLLGVER